MDVELMMINIALQFIHAVHIVKIEIKRKLRIITVYILQLVGCWF